MQCLRMDPANEDVGKELGSMCLMLLANLLYIICKCVKGHFTLVPNDLRVSSETSVFDSHNPVYGVND